MAGKIKLLQMSAWAVLLSGLMLSVIAYGYVEQQFRNEAQAKFERQSREIHRAIVSRLTSYTGLLWGLRGLYQASGRVSHREFRDYVRSLELADRYPAVMSINFAEQVTAAGRSEFIGRMRNDRSLEAGGHPDFRILQGGMRPESQIVSYMEPFEPRIFGFDLAAVPTARFEEVKTSGDFVSSGELVPHQPLLPMALRLAVYKRDLPLDSPDQRREAFMGSLGMGFSLLKLMREVVPAESLSTIRIRIHNTGRSREPGAQPEPQRRSLLIDTAGLSPPGSGFEGIPGEQDDRLSTRTRLDFGGAVLELSFESPAAAFAAVHSRFFPAAALIAGATTSLLLALLVASLLRSKTRLEAVVEERSEALHAANRALEEEIVERNRLEREVMRGLMEERRRFGQELHDNLGQQLAAAAFQIEILRQELLQIGHQSAAQIEIVEVHMDRIAAQMRELAVALNPVSEGTGGLRSALQRLADDVASNPGSACIFRFTGTVTIEEPALEHNLFRMAQQAVASALARGACLIRIELHHDARDLKLQVSDDGEELATSMANKGVDVGMRFIRYRCNVLGLALHVGPGPDGGAVVCISRQLKEREAAGA